MLVIYFLIYMFICLNCFKCFKHYWETPKSTLVQTALVQICPYNSTYWMEKRKVQNTMYAKHKTWTREKRGSNQAKWFTTCATLLLNTGKLKYLGNTFFHYVISPASKTVVRAQKSKNGEVGVERILFQEMVRGIEQCTWAKIGKWNYRKQVMGMSGQTELLWSMYM